MHLDPLAFLFEGLNGLHVDNLVQFASNIY